MSRWLALIAASLLALPSLPTPSRAADPLPRAVPESVGMSSERLQRITAALQAEVQANRIPGGVVAIARRGRLVHYEAFGYLDRARNTPMPPDAIFAIASMTKPLTGVAALLLLEEGRLALGDPVGRFLPALGQVRVAAPDQPADAPADAPVRTVAADRPITVLDLMRHTSGLTYGNSGHTAVYRAFPESSNWAGVNLSGEAFVQRVAAAPLLYQPATVWEYGLSIDVLGRVVEQVSGQRLGEFLAARLFRPLGMPDTGFVVPEDKAARLAHALPNDPATGQPQSVPDRSQPLGFDCGGGCGASTAGDYLRFAQMLLNGGTLDGTRILSPQTVRAMTSDHLPPTIRNRIAVTDPTKAGYGFGLTVAVRGDDRGTNILGNRGDFSWSGAYGTHFWVDPKEQLAVVFMTQTPGLVRQQYRRMINALVYQAIVE